MSSRRGRRGFTLAGTPADIAAKKLAAEKKKALQKDRFSALDFSSNCKDLPLQEFKGIYDKTPKTTDRFQVALDEFIAKKMGGDDD